ncbi:MAG: hypothetical protein NT027_05385 [Proteobacteria bacterium]|nr:hypothetical protein [Pseudomonadota bacterium]
MSKNLTSVDQELFKRVDEVLHYFWDPIDVKKVPQARDEYVGYVPQIFGLVRGGATVDEIVKHLSEIEGETMGLSVSETSMEHDKDVALLLLEYRAWLYR